MTQLQRARADLQAAKERVKRAEASRTRLTTKIYVTQNEIVVIEARIRRLTQK